MSEWVNGASYLEHGGPDTSPEVKKVTISNESQVKRIAWTREAADDLLQDLDDAYMQLSSVCSRPGLGQDGERELDVARCHLVDVIVRCRTRTVSSEYLFFAAKIAKNVARATASTPLTPSGGFTSQVNAVLRVFEGLVDAVGVATTTVPAKMDEALNRFRYFVPEKGLEPALENLVMLLRWRQSERAEQLSRRPDLFDVMMWSSCVELFPHVIEDSKNADCRVWLGELSDAWSKMDKPVRAFVRFSSTATSNLGGPEEGAMTKRVAWALKCKAKALKSVIIQLIGACTFPGLFVARAVPPVWHKPRADGTAAVASLRAACPPTGVQKAQPASEHASVVVPAPAPSSQEYI